MREWRPEGAILFGYRHPIARTPSYSARAPEDSGDESKCPVHQLVEKAETTPFARFLTDPLEKGGLGCSDALNLDGGPSTQLVVKLPALTLSLPGWAVPNALVVTPGRM